MKLLTSIFIALITSMTLPAEDEAQMDDLETTIRRALDSKDRRELFEMFYSPAGEAQEMEMRREVKEMFERHFRSGHGEVIVIPLKGDDYRKETMGWLTTAGLSRAPGPPFAYLELYPADENDPDYMGLNMRLSRIDGKVRIVYPELQKDVPEHLKGELSRWERADGSEFWAQFLRVVGEEIHFRDRNFEPFKVDQRNLSAKDRERIEKLAHGAENR